ECGGRRRFGTFLFWFVREKYQSGDARRTPKEKATPPGQHTCASFASCGFLMPFIAACGYCRAKMRVPSRAEGSSVTCPRCGNAFTLVPMHHPPAEGVLVAPPEDSQALPPTTEPTAEEGASSAPWRPLLGF